MYTYLGVPDLVLRAAWRDERARNQGTERALQSLMDEVASRASLSLYIYIYIYIYG